MANLAFKLEWIQKNPFNQFQLKYHKYDRVYLTELELQILEEMEFTNERLQRVKDCFVFSCYTGLSYIDVKELTEGNIVQGIDGRYWIYTKRQKTDERVKVPLLPKAIELIERYREIQEREGINGLLPISSNQKINKYLKETAEMCNISKNITHLCCKAHFCYYSYVIKWCAYRNSIKIIGSFQAYHHTIIRKGCGN